MRVVSRTHTRRRKRSSSRKHSSKMFRPERPSKQTLGLYIYAAIARRNLRKQQKRREKTDPAATARPSNGTLAAKNGSASAKAREQSNRPHSSPLKV